MWWQPQRQRQLRQRQQRQQRRREALLPWSECITRRYAARVRPPCPAACSPAASQILFTDVHVGDTPGGFASASPPSSRPNTGLPARTVFWNVRSYGGTHLPPRHSDDGGGGGGSCGYGSELTFVGVKFELAAGSSTPCQGWHYEPGPITPPNLAWAQRVRRRSQQAQAAAGGEGGAAAA